MYLKLKKGKLKGILKEAFNKSGSIRRLEKKLKIPKSTLSSYHQEKRFIEEKSLMKILRYLNKNIRKDFISKKKPNNWKQIKGGKKSVQLKKEKGVFKKQLKECHKRSSQYMKKWHKKMKMENPKKYYMMQYEKFKRIGGYKYRTNNGEKVRNELEKEVANLLKKNKIEYEYEPLIKSDNKYFFPDFLINKKVIIECTMWKGTDKAIKLKEKIKHLKKRYKVYVLIPKPLNSYYKILRNNLILGLEDFVPVAQSFRGAQKC